MSKNTLKKSINNPPRFILDTDSSRPMIVDLEGVDDYWFLDDLEEIEDLVKLLNELKELEFKLHTLRKWYTCRDCAFSEKELKYLRSLEE